MRNYLYLLAFLVFGLLINVSTAQAQCVNTPMLTSNGASIQSSGIRGICLFCNVSNEPNLVDPNTNNSARISIPVGLAGSGFIRVQLDKTYPAGTRAGFIADVNGGIAGAFNSVTLTAYLNGVQVGTPRTGSSLINLLGIGGGRNVNGVFCGPFNQLEIQVGSLVGALANYDIDYAYVTEGCTFPVQCGAPTGTEICGDGIDNDGDGLVDNEDVCTICSAGTAAPTLTATTISNVCPAATANLNTITATNKPATATLTWHTGTPATTANKVANPAAVPAGTYYAAFFDATNNCYSGVAGSATTVVTATTAAVCCAAAGIVAPSLTATTKSNTCPATTVNLTTITATNQPAGTTLTWHTGTPATNANKVTGTAVAAGTYYAAFFSAANNCYSGTGGSATTVVTATVTVCVGPVSASNPPAQTATVNQPKTGNAAMELTPTGGTVPYVYSNGSADPACVNPGGGAIALPAGSNLTITNSSTGAYTYTAPATPGTYFFCIKVCDSATPTASCTVKTYTVTVTTTPPVCNAGTTAPVLIKN